MHPQQ